MKRRIFSKIFLMAGVLCFSFILFGVSGCGGGSDSPADSAIDSESGDVVISLTDAAGDFLTYTVDVLEVALTREDGTVVQVLPLTTRVDFAQYTQTSEFLTASTIPAGVYTNVTLTLDYQNADIQVEDENGDSVMVTDLRDSDGSPISTLDVSVQLEDRNAIVIARGIPKHVSLDFDLNASNIVNETYSMITIRPVLIAELNFSFFKAHRLRGALKSINHYESSFEVVIRPFFHGIANQNGRFGRMTVTVVEDTVFDIDGEMYTGLNGLTALENMTKNSAVIIAGELKLNPKRFEAQEVYAGSSVPGSELDAIHGHVVRRTENVIVIKGANVERKNGIARFNDTVVVRLGDETKVYRQLSAESFDIQAISVGQKVTVLGTLTGVDDAPEMDAQLVRMHLTRVTGSVVDSAEEILTVDLQKIDSRGVDLFTFDGTGDMPENDADPQNYEIDLQGLTLATLEPDAIIYVLGFMKTFGQAPADFIAFSATEMPERNQNYICIQYDTPSDYPFIELTPEELTINIDAVHKINIQEAGNGNQKRYHRGVMEENADAYMIVPATDSDGEFVIKYRETCRVYSDFSNFVTAVSELLEGGGRVHVVHADGDIDTTSKILTARFMVMHLN